MSRWLHAGIVVVAAVLLPLSLSQLTRHSSAVEDDPLVRMPGTQPNQGVVLEAPQGCLACHGNGYDKAVEPGFNWQGSMMAHAARDFLFWPALTVAGQDAQWATGRPTAMDLCLRCHMPKGWLEGRSDPVNASGMTGADYDGVHCDMCHRMYDPFFEDTFAGTRAGDDWTGFWDESGAAAVPSQEAAEATREADRAQSRNVGFFNGTPFFGGDGRPIPDNYRENGGGQYYVSAGPEKRASFADAYPAHPNLYSRFHRSKYFCASCHDVSNAVLANVDFADATRNDRRTVLPTERNSAHSYFHIERTFSEFMLSAYGADGGAPGSGPFAPDRFDTSHPGNAVATCQDCHMRDVPGRASNMGFAVERPDGSIEHPNSGVPLHDLTGGNVFVSRVLASAVPGSPNYDPTNDALLNQGADVLTLDLSAGLGINPEALLAGAERAQRMLESAATIKNIQYDGATGALSFRIVNHTGHKLISGYPEGRRMFLNARLYAGEQLLYELNPYDAEAGTLKGLGRGAALGAREAHDDALVFEVKQGSTLTGESHTFHMALATHRHKDNRIPPKGFRIDRAPERLSEPAWDGASAPAYFSADEYAGGYDDVSITAPAGADRVELSLYYQTTSREYIEFLRDEINAGPSQTLPGVAYVVQGDPFFAKLKAWGDTVWQLWEHNKDVPGAAPVLMARAVRTRPDGGDRPFDAADIEAWVDSAVGVAIPDIDMNGDGKADALDLQAAVNGSLSVPPVRN